MQLETFTKESALIIVFTARRKTAQSTENVSASDSRFLHASTSSRWSVSSAHSDALLPCNLYRNLTVRHLVG